MTQPALALVKPEEFFRERVIDARSTLKIAIDDQVEFYLVNLLCDFIAPHKLNEDTLDVLGTPLALMLKNALEAGIDQRVKIYKRLADTSLYIAGYFQDYFNRKTFDITYYIAMGTNAYQSLSVTLKERHGEDQFTEMYADLAEQFGNLVDIVAEVSSSGNQHAQNAASLVAIYERWTQTQSERLRRILESNGISPIPVAMKQAQ